MKSIVALFFVVAVAYAKPSGVLAPLAIPTISAEIATQYLVQDSAGQYTYGYSNPLSSKTEARSLGGLTLGAYNYIDGEGKLQSVSYSADPKTGFQLTSATNLPQPPAVPVVPELEAPKPVEDTPEVAEARAKHLDALKEAEARSSDETAVVTTETETTIPALKVVPGVARAVTALPLNAPLISYNYGIPGAAVTYSTYTAPLLTGYNSLVSAPFLTPFAPIPSIPGFFPAPAGVPAITEQQTQQEDVQNDSVTVEAKASKE